MKEKLNMKENNENNCIVCKYDKKEYEYINKLEY